MHNQQKQAFTLIELSIVLVIIGLIVGGIVVGKDMIKAAEERKFIRQKETYVIAVNSFKSKYNCLPGDCPNATQFFGTLSSCPTDWSTTDSRTCNGNGNGYVGAYYSTGGQTDVEWMESLKFWSQLSWAGMLDKTYSGFHTGSSNSLITNGTDIPASLIGTNAGIRMARLDHPDSTLFTDLWPISYGNSFYLIAGTAWFWGGNAPMNAADTFRLDTKLDDGRPMSGAMVVPRRSQAWMTCVTTDDMTTTAYNTTSATMICIPIFRNVF